MSTIDNINGIYAKDTELRNGISDLRGDILSQTIKPLNITENGTYTSDPTAGAYGYSPVTVNVPSTINYSTTEQNTGRKWIDGKPIYQKTFVPVAPATYWAGTDNTIDISDLDVDTFIKVDGLGADSADCTTNIWNIEAMSTAGVRSLYYPDKDTIAIYMQSGYIFWITLYYTKTTDTVK